LTGLYVASANEAYRPRSRHPDSGQTGVLGSPYFQGRQRPDPVASAVSAPVFLFCIFVIGGARAFSWLFGYDDEMKIWAAENRPLVAIVLVLSAIMYAMYVWLEEDRGP
jgi:hypothetical protein